MNRAMKRIQRNMRSILFLLCGVFLRNQASYAQEVTGTSVLLGGRILTGDSSSSKFSEYRDLRGGLFSNLCSLQFTNDDRNRSLILSGLNVGQLDQTFEGQYVSSRDLKLRVRWDQIPHDYTNTARTIYSGAGSGVLRIPADIRSRLRTLVTTDVNPQRPGIQFDSSALATFVNGLARPVDVVSRREKANGDLKFSPTDEITVRLNYSNERRTGIKPLSGVFYYQTPTEILEPTDYRTQELNGTVEYATKVWTAQAGYSASVFRNNVDVLIWDNPFRESDVLAGTSRARMDLAPDNWTHRLSFSGAANLPLSTRLVTSASYSVRRQNDGFIPYTINRAVDTLPNLPALPAQSLDGRVENTFFNASLVSRVSRAVSLSLRYRVVNYRDESADVLFPGFVDEDNLVTRVVRRNLLVSYRKNNFSGEVAFKEWSALSLRGGYERENWNRSYGEAVESGENIYRLIADYMPSQFLSVRSSFLHGDKEVPVYDWTKMENALYPSGRTFGILAELPQLRKFDLAARKRNSVNLLTQVSPLQYLTVAASYGFTFDRFGETSYGLTFDKSNTISFNISVTPSLDYSFNGYYTFEHFHYGLDSRQRTFGNDAANNDWASDMKDLVHTYGCSVTWSVVPDVTELLFDFSMTAGWGRVATQILGDQGSHGFIVTTAQDYPDTRTILRRFSVAMRYHLTEHLTPQLAYRFEGYTESRFAEDGMQPSMIVVDPTLPRAIYLGAIQPGYAVHMLYIALSYEL
jgi:MtrB/PioB family decaheme-associated outer membrane protein